MIQVDDILDMTVNIERYCEIIIGLIETVRTKATQAAIMPFLEHLRGVVNEANEAMSTAVTCLNNTDTLDNQTFAKVYAAGSIHGAMVMFCRALVNDLSDHVRLAGATGEIILSQMETTLDHVRVIKVIQERLNMKS